MVFRGMVGGRDGVCVATFREGRDRHKILVPRQMMVKRERWRARFIVS